MMKDGGYRLLTVTHYGQISRASHKYEFKELGKLTEQPIPE